MLQEQTLDLENLPWWKQKQRSRQFAQASNDLLKAVSSQLIL